MNRSNKLLNISAYITIHVLLFLFSCNPSETTQVFQEQIDSTSLDSQTLTPPIFDTMNEAIQVSDLAGEIAAEVEAFEEGKAPAKPNNNVLVKVKEPVSEKPKVSENPIENKEKIPSKIITPEPIKEEVIFSHQAFDDLLQKYVTTSGKVNYQGFKSERKKLQSYLADLKNNEPKATDSKNKKLAYWINVYNAYTIELILQNNIPTSIKDINNGRAWDIFFVEIGSKKYSLNNIEHDIIRKQFGDARIHFACVCAAKSCPKLLNQAYTEANLNTKLDQQATDFINDKTKNQIADGNLKISELFNWYAGDFGNVNDYLKKYYNGSFKEDKKIEYMNYDWSLNN